MKNPLSLLIGLLVVIVGGYIVWWLASPLFIDQTVDEAFPATVEELPAADPEIIAAVPEAQRPALQADMQPTAEAMPDEMGADDMPTETAAEPIPLRMGSFVDADDFHQGEGTATIYQFPDGQFVLRFEEFEVTNGPDLHVLLSPSADPLNEGLGEYIDLGSLKGNSGNQNYPIPESVDISQYNSIVIYCSPFHVNFAAAMLQ